MVNKLGSITKLGILVPHLHNNQLGYEVTKQLNKLKESNPKSDSIVFTEEDRPQTLVANFGIMNISEAYDQTGLIIATTPNTASKLIHFWGANHKVFYNYDCFWLRGQRNSYEHLLNLYLNNEFDLICRSESHKTLLENNFNTKVKAIVENFNIKEILNMYSNIKIDSNNKKEVANV